MRMTAVVGTRNDGYGGHDPDRRFIFSMESLLHYFDEVVVVDWNSPGDKTMLQKNKEFISHTGRILEVVVTREDLEELGLPLNIPISEVHFRNIGIRRASNDWVVSTNPDICPVDWFPVELKSNVLYVSPRSDTWTFKHYDKHESKEFLSHLIYHTHTWEKKPRINNPNDPWSKIVCCGDFQLAHKNLWENMSGFEESMIFRSFADTNLNKKAEIYGGGVEVVDTYHIAHLNHSGHMMESEGKELLNDQRRYIQDFKETANGPNWGVPHYQFLMRRW